MKVSRDRKSEDDATIVPSAGGELRAGRTRRHIRASTPGDGPAIVALMREAGLDPQVQLQEHLYWKYWQERADWTEPRSFVLVDGDQILAHGAVVPGRCRWGATWRKVFHMIDWAAAPGAAGAGVLLMKHVGRLADCLLGIGGSENTLKLMPLIGYRRCGAVTGHVRALSPVSLLKKESSKLGWRLIPRLVRSSIWSMAAPTGESTGWQTYRIRSREVDRIASVLPVARSGVAVFERTEGLFSHLLACPIIPVELYAVEKAGRIGGYFLVSYAPGQARLADAWMTSENPADWRSLIHAAVRQVKLRGDLAEFVAWSSDSLLSQALQECGFHERLTLPIYLRGSGDVAVADAPVRVQMVENDAFYLGQSDLWA